MRDQLASPAERRALGKALRDKLPRKAHATFTPPPDRPDVMVLIDEEANGRDPDLLPRRWERMTASPFASFRGAAGVFAFDLARAPTAGVDVQLCGDAHAFNLGAYAAPDGHLVFDLNDFDHACRGPFEWDLKRLAASFVLAGRESGHDDDECRDAAIALVASYRIALDQFAGMRVVDVARLEIKREDDHRPLTPIFAEAARDTPQRLLRRVTTPAPDGRARFRDDPPMIRPIADDAAVATLHAALDAYRATLGAGRLQIAQWYRPYHVARRGQGVGSLGLAGWVVLCYGNGAADPLFLHVKEIGSCAWTPWLAAGAPERTMHQGQRATEAQARTQTVSDPFLGWATVGGAQCVVRQWSDHKGRCELEMLAGRSLYEYAELCGQVLAKAHARTGDAAMLAGYCGRGDNLDLAIASFGMAYADQAQRDFDRLVKARRAAPAGSR